MRTQFCSIALLAVLQLLYSSAQGQEARPADGFVGSAACKDCHSGEYERWRQTRMANVIVDAQAHP
jgi:hypothetical protein